MDLLEEKFVNSPIKRIMLKYFELNTFSHFLIKHNISLRNKIILDAGCGAGNGLVNLSKTFSPRKLYGIDISPREVQISRKRDVNAIVLLRDLVHTQFPSETFDAVFVFTVLHHIIQWRDALKKSLEF